MSSHFKKLPKISNDTGNNGKNFKKVTNIFNVSSILEKYASNPNSHYEYTVKEGETPELIANLYYGDPSYNWVILFMNGIRNVYDEWPLPSRKLHKIIANNYGSKEAAMKIVTHYNRKSEGQSGYLVTSAKNDRVSINVFYEKEEFKTNIKDLLIHPSDAYQLVKVNTTTHKISNQTWAMLPDGEKGEYTPYHKYDEMVEKNEKYRVIKLLSKSRLADFIAEFERVSKL